MKKFLKALLILILLFAVAAAVLAYFQRENLTSVITSYKYTNKEIAAKIDDNKKDTESKIKAYTDNIIRDFTHEEEEQIRRGEVSTEEVISRILKESAPQIQNEKAVDLDTIIGEHISQMYMLKAAYIGKLGELERRAKSDYKALSKEKRGSAGKQSIISKYVGEAAALEKECDGRVNQVLESLQVSIKAHNGDMSLIKTMRKAYEEEKILKKSYYLNMYK